MGVVDWGTKESKDKISPHMASFVSFGTILFETLIISLQADFRKLFLPPWADERATQGVQNFPLASPMAFQGRRMGQEEEELRLVQLLLRERGLILVLTSPQPRLLGWGFGEPVRWIIEVFSLRIWISQTCIIRSALSKGGLMFGSQNNLSYLSSAAATSKDSTSSSTLKPGRIGLDLVANVP